MDDGHYFAIGRLGAEMVACDRRCQGITCDQARGVLPRYLVLELSDPDAPGCVIVGRNPGLSTADEMAYYRDRGGTHRSVVEFFIKHQSRSHPYYLRLREFAEALGLAGSILWTELVKCQNAAGFQGLLPLQTVRTCSELYLRRELESVPPEWPLIGVGREPYKALALLYQDRPVLGIPHPLDLSGPITVLRNRWQALFDGPALAPAILTAAKATISSRTATWLGKGALP